jgi:cobalt/nickel transport system permease protein
MAVAAIADRHVAGDSLLHGLDPRAKLVASLLIIFTTVLIPAGRWDVFALMACLLATATAASGLSPRLVLGRSLLALPFLLAAVPIIFNRAGEGVVSLPLLGWTVTDAGLVAFFSILLRSWLSVITATLLTATTEPDSLLRSLRWLGVPRILVATASFMWRYIFVIGEEAQRLLRAREARSARPGGRGGGSPAWRARVAGYMAGTLFLRTLSRSERIYAAMQARGYNGEFLTLDRLAMRKLDYAVLSLVAVFLAGLNVYAYSL